MLHDPDGTYPCMARAPGGKRHRETGQGAGSSHRCTDSHGDKRRLDLASSAVQCLEWQAGSKQRHQQFEIHFCPIFRSHSAILLPKHQPATTTTAPFAPSRHADTARADLSQHRRRPVTRFPSPSIAHRPPAACADIHCQFQVPKARRAEVESHQDLPRSSSPRIAAEQSSPQDSSIRPRAETCRSFRFHPILTALQAQPAPARNTRREHAAWRPEPPPLCPPSALRLGHPPISILPSAICHRPSPLRGAVAWPPDLAAQCWAGMQSPGYPPRSSSPCC